MNGKDKGLNRLDYIFLRGIGLHRHDSLRKLWKLQSVGRNAVTSTFKRWWHLKKDGLLVPPAIAFSPTMRCNLSCIGCYAKDYPKDDELPMELIDEMLSSGEKLGVFLFVITGGEPLMREGILEVFQRHRKLLFLLITNGTLMDDEVAKEIANAGNIVPVVSTEGSKEQTDTRRGSGVYDDVINAMECLERQKILFGFSSTVTRYNYQTLSSDQFIADMVNKGCSLGFYTEYVSIGEAEWDMTLEDEDRDYFRKRVLEIRKTKPIMVAHLPDDEYGSEHKCRAVESGCIHINAQGYVEPCPFSHFSGDNIKEKSLEEVFRSKFMDKIRASEAIYRNGRLGCALLENLDIVQDIAEETGAKSTDCLLTKIEN
jgi:MoaA/NifB/PqqE/SkfB family radical SAM enzyme